MESRILIYSGAAGGKSTFIGGLLQHFYDRDDSVVTYEVDPGRADKFQESVIGPMIQSKSYPEQTDRPYVVHYSLAFDSSRRDDATLSLIDYPGTMVDQSTQLFPASEESIHNRYSDTENIPSKINTDEALTESELQTFIQYQFMESEKVIFPINIHKIANHDNALAFDLELIKRAAEEKDVAVVITATDILGYDPTQETEEESKLLKQVKDRTGIGGDESIDEELLAAVSETIPRSQSLQLDNILNGVKAGSGADLFGVAVPEDEGQISGQGDSFVTIGFDQVIDWAL